MLKKYFTETRNSETLMQVKQLLKFLTTAVRESGVVTSYDL